MIHENLLKRMEDLDSSRIILNELELIIPKNEGYHPSKHIRYRYHQGLSSRELPFYYEFTLSMFRNNKCSLCIITIFLFFTVFVTMLMQSIGKAIPAIIFQMNISEFEKVDFRLIDYNSDTYMNYSNAKKALERPELKGIDIAPRMYKLGAIGKAALGIIAIDSQQEDKFMFDDGFVKVGPGECIVNSKAAGYSGVEVGQSLTFEVSDSMLEMYLGSKIASLYGDEHMPTPSKYNMTLRVIQVAKDFDKRISTQLPFNIFVDITSYLQVLASFRSQAIEKETVFNEYLSKQKLADYSSTLKFRLGSPESIYYHADIADTKRAFNKQLTQLELALNIDNINIGNNKRLFDGVYNKEVIMTLLSCMLLIVFAGLTLLSGYVISSIFGNMVLDRFRELSLLRLIGIRRRNLAGIYLLQSTLIGVAATLMAIPMLYLTFGLINDRVLRGSAESYTLTFSKESLLVGLIFSISIPFFSTLLSVLSVTRSHIAQGLDNNRPLSSMQVQVGPQEEKAGRVIACLIVVVYGLGIYVFIPLTLIRGEIFFTFMLLILIAVSLCLGIAFLLMNMWKWANKLTETIVLIFDKPYIMDLVSNVKGIHYSTLSRLAWTIMIGTIIVTTLHSLFTVIFAADKLSELRDLGGPVITIGSFTGKELSDWSQSLLNGYNELSQAYILHPDIKAYSTKNQINTTLPLNFLSTLTHNIGRIKSLPARARGVTPNYPDLAATRFVDVEWPTHASTSLTPFEYLYTRFGYGEVIIPEEMRKSLSINCKTLNSERTFSYEFYMASGDIKSYHMNCSAVAFDLPGLICKKSIDREYPAADMVMDIPSIVSLHEDQPGFEIDRLNVHKYFIRPSSGKLNAVRIFELLMIFRTKVIGLSRKYFFDEDQLTNSGQIKVSEILTTLLNSVMYCIFIIKFTFGLASMLRKQQKEVGVYKSMGMDVNTIARIFFYEVYSTILVAGAYAIIASYILCHLLGLQLEIFTALIADTTVPISSFVYLFIGGFVLSLISVYMPILKIAKMQTVDIRRLPD